MKEGKVYLFQLDDQGQPSRDYETFAKFARLCYQGNEDMLSDADFYTNYYTNIIANYSSEDNVTPKREKLRFQDVADIYRIINGNTTSLFIYRYDKESLSLYNTIKDKEYLSRKDYQQIAQYSVQVYEWFTKANADKIGETLNGVKIWFGAYSKEIGLNNEDEIFYI